MVRSFQLPSGTRFAVTWVAGCFVLVVSGCSELQSREDFANRIKDKSEKEVVKEVGKPAKIETHGDQVRYIYTSRTFKIESGNKIDAQAVVVFSPTPGGIHKAAEVLYE